jgi:hypothetical protein
MPISSSVLRIANLNARGSTRFKDDLNHIAYDACGMLEDVKDFPNSLGARNIPALNALIQSRTSLHTGVLRSTTHPSLSVIPALDATHHNDARSPSPSRRSCS